MNLTAETEAKQTKLPDMSAARQRTARSRQEVVNSSYFLQISLLSFCLHLHTEEAKGILFVLLKHENNLQDY